MNNRYTFSISITIWLIVNNLDPFYRNVWVNIASDNMSADSADTSYHVAQAVSSAIYEAMLHVLTDLDGECAVRTLNVGIQNEACTHIGRLAYAVFPMNAEVEASSKPEVIHTYSPEVARYIYHFLDNMRVDIEGLLKSLAAAHFGDTHGGEGNRYAVTCRSVAEEP